MEPKQKKNDIVRIIVVGEENVGKTAIINCFLNKEINLYPKMSLGADLSIIREFCCKNDNDKGEKKVDVHLIDVASSMKFSSYKDQVFEFGDAFIYVFDVTKRDSLQKLYDWNKEINEVNNSPKYLCGNKYDKKDDKEVVDQEIKAFNDILGTNGYFATSVMSKEDVSELFHEVIKAADDFLDQNEFN